MECGASEPARACSHDSQRKVRQEGLRVPVPGAGQGQGASQRRRGRQVFVCGSLARAAAGDTVGGGEGGRNALGSIYARAAARVTHTQHHPHQPPVCTTSTTAPQPTSTPSKQKLRPDGCPSICVWSGEKNRRKIMQARHAPARPSVCPQCSPSLPSAATAQPVQDVTQLHRPPQTITRYSYTTAASYPTPIMCITGNS